MGLLALFVAGAALASPAAATAAPAPTADVALDPHYAPLFTPGNSWVYDLWENPEGNKKQRKWRETCTVTASVATLRKKLPALKATVTCVRDGKGKTKLAATYVADAKGLLNPRWWGTDGSFPRALPRLLGNPPQTSAHAHDVLPDDKDWAPVAKIRFKGPDHSLYSHDNLYVQLSYPDTVALPDQRKVSGWSASWSYNMGSGGDMDATWAPGVGLVSARHGGGGDDEFYSSWTAKLVEFKPAGGQGKP